MLYFIRIDKGPFIPIKNTTKLFKRAKYYERKYPDSKIETIEMKSWGEFIRTGSYDTIQLKEKVCQTIKQI